MKKLSEAFVKNGIDYRILKRSGKVALFEMMIVNEIVGYEVCRVYVNEEHIMAGVTIESGESITCNSEFGTDGSKSFFPKDKDDAMDYFFTLVANDTAKNAKITTA